MLKIIKIWVKDHRSGIKIDRNLKKKYIKLISFFNTERQKIQKNCSYESIKAEFGGLIWRLSAKNWKKMFIFPEAKVVLVFLVCV